MATPSFHSPGTQHVNHPTGGTQHVNHPTGGTQHVNHPTGTTPSQHAQPYKVLQGDDLIGHWGVMSEEELYRFYGPCLHVCFDYVAWRLAPRQINVWGHSQRVYSSAKTLKTLLEGLSYHEVPDFTKRTWAEVSRHYFDCMTAGDVLFMYTGHATQGGGHAVLVEGHNACSHMIQCAGNKQGKPIPVALVEALQRKAWHQNDGGIDSVIPNVRYRQTYGAMADFLKRNLQRDFMVFRRQAKPFVPAPSGIVGNWSGSWHGDKGHKGSGSLVITHAPANEHSKEHGGDLEGSWDGKRFHEGFQNGDALTWKHYNPEYSVICTLTPDRRRLSMTYGIYHPGPVYERGEGTFSR